MSRALQLVEASTAQLLWGVLLMYPLADGTLGFSNDLMCSAGQGS